MESHMTSRASVCLCDARYLYRCCKLPEPWPLRSLLVSARLDTSVSIYCNCTSSSVRDLCWNGTHACYRTIRDILFASRARWTKFSV